jgi:hypothetical protein
VAYLHPRPDPSKTEEKEAERKEKGGITTTEKGGKRK